MAEKYDELCKMTKKSDAPAIHFKGFSDAWEQRKLGDIAVRSSVISSDSGYPRVEYEDIISGTGCLNKDIFSKESDKAGIVFHRGDVLYGKLRPYLLELLTKLITNADSNDEAINIVSLGTTYKRTGLHFDKRLEKMSDTIRYFKKNEELSFHTDDSKPVNKLIIGDN